MNIKELKEYIKDLPDDMEIQCFPEYVYELKEVEPKIEWNVLIFN